MDDLETIDISTYPDLQQFAEAVRRSHEPQILRLGDEDIAILMPISQRRGRRGRKPSQDDREAFLASAGGWRDFVDADQIMADIISSRQTSRPDIER